jgi:hypothetical protein
MQEIFKSIRSDKSFMAECKASPFMGATFYALESYVNEGHSLSELPWFDFFDISRIEQKKEANAA